MKQRIDFNIPDFYRKILAEYKKAGIGATIIRNKGDQDYEIIVTEKSIKILEERIKTLEEK